MKILCLPSILNFLCRNAHKFGVWDQNIHISSSFQAIKMNDYIDWHVIFHIHLSKNSNSKSRKILFWHDFSKFWSLCDGPDFCYAVPNTSQIVLIRNGYPLYSWYKIKSIIDFGPNHHVETYLREIRSQCGETRHDPISSP